MAFAHLYVHSIPHLCRIMAQVAFIFVLDLKKDFYDIR